MKIYGILNIFLAGLLGWMVLVGSGCRGGVSSEPGLVVALEVEPQTVDPRFATDAYSSKISHLIFSGLVDYDETFKIHPDLAESFRIDQETHYRFRLRPGLKFSDGTPLTAADVVATLASVMAPASTSPFKSGLKVIREMKAVSSKEIEIWLDHPYAPFMSLMTLGIVKQEAPERIGWRAEEVIGCGPYRFVSRLAGQSLQLAANPHTWGDPPLEANLKLRVIPDETTRALELMHGRVDLVLNGVPPLLLNMLQSRGLQVVTEKGENYSYLMFNLHHPALANLKVRQAIAQAIPIESLIRHRLAGRARRGTGILPPEHWAYEPRVENYPYNPDAATQLLDEAGFPDPDGVGPLPRFSITYKTSNRKDRVMMAKLIARYLAEVGIEVKIRPLEWGTYFSDIRSGRFDMASLTWVGIVEPDIFYDLFQSGQIPPVGNNRGGYNNSRVDQLVVQGRNLSDQMSRARIYREVQRIVAHELPYVSLWYEDNVVVAQAHVTGIHLDPRASLNFLTHVRLMRKEMTP